MPISTKGKGKVNTIENFSLFDELDKLFTDRFSKNFFDVGEGHLEDLHYDYPKSNVFKNKNTEDGTIDYIIELQVPGMSRKDLDVNIVDNNTIEIVGELNKPEIVIPEDVESKEKEQLTKKCCISTQMVNSEDSKPTWFDGYICELNGFNLKSNFRRKFLIPNIDLESLKATVKDGILVIQLKSGKRKEYRKIEIQE